jgi:GGDEF domain-containing protein
MLQTLYKRAFGPKNIDADLAKLKTMQARSLMSTFEPSPQSMKTVAKLLKQYAREHAFAYMASHIISVIALDEENAIFLLELGVFKTLNSLLILHSKNPRVLVKACAAMWNLLGVSEAAEKVPKKCFMYLWSTIIRHQASTKVIHTALGALSNLALVAPSIMQLCLRTLMHIFRMHRTNTNICNHFGALVANLCVNWHVAEKCIRVGYVAVLLDILRVANDNEVFKHVLAALHNMSDATDFKTHFCLNQGIEIFARIQESADAPEIHEYIEGIFEQASIPQTCTSSLHLAVVSCSIGVTVDILLKHNETMDILDREGNSACDLAMREGNCKVVELLVASGAQYRPDSFADIPDFLKKEDIAKSVKKGTKHRTKSHQMMKSLVTENTKMIKDMGQVVTDFIPGVEMLLMLQN